MHTCIRTAVLNRRTAVRIRTQTQSNLDRSQIQHSTLITIQASFHWCVISRYIYFSNSMWFQSSVSNPEVQSGAVITVTMTTHSLNVDHELCGSRRLCVSKATTRAGRFVNGIFFLSKRKSSRALNPTKKEKLIPKIANLKQSGLTTMHLCCVWGAQNRRV